MPEDRGEYRPIYSVLTDSPEFQALSKDARILLYTIKLSLGASGIDVLYDDQILERSALTRAELKTARAELVDGKWIEVEARIHWLRNGLRFEPTLSLNNDNHVKSIVRHIAGLPKLPIVARFAAYYDVENPFPAMGSGGDRNGTANPIAIPERSEGTENGVPEPEQEPEKEGGARKRSRATQIPESWEPNDGHATLATELKLSLNEQAERFRDHARASGRTLKDWDAGFRNWLRKAPEFQPKSGASPPRADETKIDRARAAEAAERQKQREQEERRKEAADHEKRVQEARQWYENLDTETKREVDEDWNARLKIMRTGGVTLTERVQQSTLMAAIFEHMDQPTARAAS